MCSMRCRALAICGEREGAEAQPNAAGSSASASSTALRVSASPLPARSAVDVVAAAARPAGGIARPAPGEPPAPVPHPLFLLFYLVEIRHHQLHNDNPAPAQGADARRDIVRLWQLFGRRAASEDHRYADGITRPR